MSVFISMWKLLHYFEWAAQCWHPLRAKKNHVRWHWKIFSIGSKIPGQDGTFWHSAVNSQHGPKLMWIRKWRIGWQKKRLRSINLLSKSSIQMEAIRLIPRVRWLEISGDLANKTRVLFSAELFTFVSLKTSDGEIQSVRREIERTLI